MSSVRADLKTVFRGRSVRGILSDTAQEYLRIVAGSVLSRWLTWCFLVLLALYVWVVLYLAVVGPVPTMCFPLVLLMLIWLLLPRCYRWSVRLGELFGAHGQQLPMPCAFAVGGCIAALYVLYACLCGIWNNGDTTWQWQQAGTGCFHDWHPVIHTAILWCIGRLWYNQIFAVCVQCVVFGGLCGWLYGTMRRYGYSRAAIWGTVLYCVVSPGTQEAMRILWKDTAFALASMALCIVILHVWHTSGGWLCNVWHAVVLCVLVVLVGYLRHNGILLAVPFVVLMPLQCRGWKRRMWACALSLLAMACMCGYALLRAHFISDGLIEHDPDQRYFEAIGIPMSIMAAHMLRSPATMPADVREMLLEICSENDWQKYYRGEGFADCEGTLGSIKDHFDCRTAIVTRSSRAGFLLQTWRVFWSNPILSFKTLVSVTGNGWNPLTTRRLVVANRNHGYPLDYLMSGVRADLLAPPLCWLFVVPGMQILLMVVSGVFGILKHGLKALAVFVPFVVYAYGTSLLTYSVYDSWRFYFALTLSALPVIQMMLSVRSSCVTEERP